MAALFEMHVVFGVLHIVDRFNDSTWCGMIFNQQLSDDPAERQVSVKCSACREVLDRLERVIT